MFQLTPSDRGGYNTATISDDNLQISWPKGGHPDWPNLWTERYADAFVQAQVDWANLLVHFEQQAIFCKHAKVDAWVDRSVKPAKVWCGGLRDSGAPDHERPGGLRKFNRDA